MKIINLTCPNCGSHLQKKDNETLRCVSCRSEFLLDTEKNNYYTTNNYYTEKKYSHKQTNTGVLVFLFIFFITVSAGIILYNSLSSDTPTQEIQPAMVRDVPESAGAIEFVERVFNKNIDAITAQELQSIKYLEVADYLEGDGFKFSYSLTSWTNDDGEYPLDTIIIDKKIVFEVLDITSLKGLNYLDFNNSYDVTIGDNDFTLQSLPELIYYGHTFNQPLGTIIDGLSKDSNLKYLKTQLRSNSEFEQLSSLKYLRSLELSYVDEDFNLKQLAELDNLYELEINSFGHSDIKWVSAMSNLTSLSIFNAKDILDYHALFSLANLKKLTISEGAYLKDISFVNNMPQLKKLAIKNCALNNIQSLGGKQSLSQLELVANKTKDFGSIKSLDNLTHLTLQGLDHSSSIPNLKSLAYLTDVTIDVPFLDVLKDTASIKTLAIQAGQADLNYLASLSQLEELQVSDATLENMSGLQSLSNLKTVKLNNISADSNNQEGNNLFKLAQVENLFLDEDVELTFTHEAKFNLSELRKLVITDPQKLRLLIENKYQEFDSIGISFLTSKLAAAPKLEHLSLPQANVDDLSFTSELANLKMVDFSNNYITEVAPLTKLEKLIQVNISNNPIMNSEILPESVHIIK